MKHRNSYNLRNALTIPAFRGSMAGLLIVTFAAACGGSDSDSLVAGDGDGGECKVGQIYYEGEGDDPVGVCVSEPNSDNTALALPEYVEGILNADEDVFNDPLALGCAGETVFPRVAADSSAKVTVAGLLTKFGKAMEPVGLCVAILDYEKFMNSDCARKEREDREACFGVNLCVNSPPAGIDFVLGWTASTGFTEDAGRYEIPGIPVERNLIIRASGPSTTWVDTYKYGIFIPASEAGLGTIEIEASIISKSSWQTVPATAQVPRGIQPGNGAIAGTVQDCGEAADESNGCLPGPDELCDCDSGFVCSGDGEDGFCQRLPWSIVGATIGVSTRATNIAYFQGHEGDNLPAPGLRYTNILGTFVVIDAEGGPTDIVATVHDGDSVKVVGRSHIFMVPHSVAIYTFRGERTGHYPWYI
jgi:hypothetical protein